MKSPSIFLSSIYIDANIVHQPQSTLTSSDTFDSWLCAAYSGAEAAALTYTKEAPAFMELMAVGQGRVFCPALPSFPIKLNSTLHAHATAQKEENLFPASAGHTFKALCLSIHRHTRTRPLAITLSSCLKDAQAPDRKKATLLLYTAFSCSDGSQVATTFI